jgi:putative FmdB family regulatory protein
MAVYDLVCKSCGHAFTVSLAGAIKTKHKRCPECRSRELRQTFGSYLRNGSLAAQGCRPRGGYG